MHRRRPLGRRWLEVPRALTVVAVGFVTADITGGSGFLAVFLAGILLGDEEHAPMEPIRHAFDWLSSAAEVIAFVVLGLTVDLNLIGHANVWRPGLVIAAVLALVVRPVAAACCLVGSSLRRKERVFVAWAGLKGAVPILLGSLLLGAKVATPQRYYAIIVVVVMISVVVQGGLIPLVARLLRIRLIPLD
jgi:cell volume regulation protein A